MQMNGHGGFRDSRGFSRGPWRAESVDVPRARCEVSASGTEDSVPRPGIRARSLLNGPPGRSRARALGYDAAVTLLRTAILPALLMTLAAPYHAAEPEVRVILWFDTEDYLLPASDDAARRIAEILTERGIRGTFKIVGEKARVLEARGRHDVIEALRKHDIGYHTNLHSVHPTPSEYLAEAGWLEGIAEFVRRERAGAEDVRRIFGVGQLSTYGQPGSSWAPQAVAALPEIGVMTASGVPTYVDEGSHVGVGGAPFWYVGALHVFNMETNITRMPLHEKDGLSHARKAFRAIYDRLRGEGGGLISVYYHPAEWVHEEFWDAVNFERGANPPREQWVPPPQRSRAETQTAYREFAEYIDFQRSLAGVRFITAADLPNLYRDRIRNAGADRATVARVAERVAGGETLDSFQDPQGRWISPADQFVMLMGFVARAVVDRRVPETVPVFPVHGPAEGAPTGTARELPWPAFRDAIADVADSLRAQRRVPSRVFAGTQAFAPADFLRAAAPVALAMSRGAGKTPAFPDRVNVPAGTAVGTERFIANDMADLFGGWIIHPENFRAPDIVAMAKLQAWTLKPADVIR